MSNHFTKVFISLSIWLAASFACYGQGEFNIWYFGSQAGLDFNSGMPLPLLDCGSWGADSQTCVSDSLGNFLFSANYMYAVNRNHVVMPNGNGLLGGSLHIMQTDFSVQKLDDDSLYFIFTMGSYGPSWGTNGLRYSILNMRLNGGLGDIDPSQKNIVVPGATDATAALTGIRHHNNKDAWIVVRKWNSSGPQLYASYLITHSGFSMTPIFSNSNYFLLFGSTFDNIKQIKISPDGSKMICVYDTAFEYCAFNNTNGEITPLFTGRLSWINNVKNVPNSAEFSVDSKFLYLSSNYWSGGMLNNIYQFDATKVDSLSFMQSKILLGQFYSSSSGLQRGSDDKIYGTKPQHDSLNVIQFPNISGIGCLFIQNSISLLGRNSGYSLPQFLQKYKAYIHHSNLCQNDSVHFTGDILPPPDSVHWNFGDPTSGAQNYSNLSGPSHIYQNTGTYTVELFVRHNDNRTDTSWQTITIVASPQVSLGIDRSICVGDSTTFDAGACAGCTYSWKNLSSGLIVGVGQTFNTGIAGSYEVTVTNSNGCSGKDTVQLVTTPVPLITNNPLTKSICSGESTNITLTSSPGANLYYWTATLTSGTISGFSQDSGLVINQVLTNSLLTAGVVTYHITPKVGSCSGPTIDYTVTVNPGNMLDINISTALDTVCAGTLVTYTAIPTTPGGILTYQWKVNGVNTGINSTSFSYIPSNNDLVTCVLNSSLIACVSNNPATSNVIMMVVKTNLAVSVTITAVPPTVCAGSTMAFTAHPTSGGLSPSYQWQVNGSNAGTNSSTYSYIPANGDLVSCTLTSSEICTTNNPASSIQYAVSVSPILPVSITISTPTNPFCLGSSVTFTGLAINGAPTATFQWMVNGINAGANSNTFTYNSANGDLVNCVYNSPAPCLTGNPATSNTIAMLQNNSLPASVSITPSSNPFCPGSAVSFTAIATHGGLAPLYQWIVNGANVGTNSSIYSYNPNNGDSIRVIMTSNLACVSGSPCSSAKIIMSGNLAPSVTFTACFDTITTVNAKPIKLKGGIPLDGIYSGPGVNSGTSYFNPAAAGVGTKTITYSYTNAASCSASKSISILDLPSSILTCGNSITDVRDNKVYQTIQIGSQCWMASNLNFGTFLTETHHQRDNCMVEKYCYQDNVTNCSVQGGFYQWDELMQYEDTEPIQGLCPPAWHIPSEAEWNLLFAVYTNNGFAAGPLKNTGYSGFNAFLNGVGHQNETWDWPSFATFYWSSTSHGSYKAWAHGMNSIDPSVSLYSSYRSNAFAIRCLHD